ncbi:phosphoglycerate mutase [Caloranaerobacter sp. TR13]|uniref:histidine phosphatase family protein n=1 Tax=Caloranaerobacter sp. TR13 TaxID=1302151 RepID=UPI0006D40732|nr:histidine phosphatase family protein [Caloranaerobacter sp. TR13]KPU28131.1 phosphoglycerate mutase [Caloranaerobacter sp. TR13]
MKKIIITRHGQTNWNIIGKVQGQKDIKLNEIGINQAKKLAIKLSKEKIDVIYTSDLKRSYQTAKIISDIIKTNIIIDKNLREICFGNWQGLTLTQIKKDFNKEYIIWRTKPHKFSLPGAEKLIEVQERMKKVINKVLHSNYQNILIVSHSTAIKALILGILDIDLAKFNNIKIDNTSITIIEYHNTVPIIRLLNDTCHLKED